MPARGSQKSDGVRLIGGHFPRAVAIQLNVLAAQLETTNRTLLGDALDMLFRAHKLPTIEQLTMADTGADWTEAIADHAAAAIAQAEAAGIKEED